MDWPNDNACLSKSNVLDQRVFKYKSRPSRVVKIISKNDVRRSFLLHHVYTNCVPTVPSPGMVFRVARGLENVAGKGTANNLD
jgi:hypothetical protein